jgi:hypothetical protein
MLGAFREIVLADFEFAVVPGNRPEPVCLVAHELRSGRAIRLWQDQFGPAPPYVTGPDVLFVAYYASAELGCYHVLGWPMPERILDLFTEFRARTNGLETPAGRGLLGALAYFGLDGIGASEKTEMRDLVLRGGPWSEEEQTAILDYCASDVAALGRLLPAMLPGIDLPRALLRGRYMAAAAAMEHAGVPIDVDMLQLFRQRWTDIQDQLIHEIDASYGVFDGRTFKADRFARWLTAQNIPWPMLESGHLDLADDTFRHQARAYPAVSPLRELRSSLSDLRLNDLAIGCDGRNRTLLSAFQSRTGRNQPSNSKYIFGPSVWLRGLIKPPAGHGIAYVDWSQQEFGIAAALSGAIHIWPSPSKPARSRAMPARKRTGRPASCLSSVRSQCSMEWARNPWRSALRSRRASRAISCARIGRPIAGSGPGRMPPSIKQCLSGLSTRCSAGRSTSARKPTRDPCAISPCKPTAPKCCESPAVSAASAGSRCVLRSMMRC